MVVQSTRDYERHKQEIFELIKARYGEKYATRFITFYADRWDKYGRSYIDYRLGFWLLDDYYHVKNLGTKWYGIVGPGGMGKSTLAANMFYFLDPTLDASRANITTVEKFVEKLSEYSVVGSMKAVFMDEPEDSIVSHSKEGKILRQVLGKARQQQLFLGFLATDLKDIPPYVFRKLDGMIFLPRHGQGMFFKNRPKKFAYPLQHIRMNYEKHGYGAFFMLRNSFGCLQFRTHKAIVYDEPTYKDYLMQKQRDYAQNIQSLLNELKGKRKERPKTDNVKIALSLDNVGMTQAEIAKHLGVSRQRVGQILREGGGFDAMKGLHYIILIHER